MALYNPQAFREERVDVMHALIRSHSLATLVTMGSDGIEANHVPLLLDAGAGPHGTLRGHVARANPLWRDFDPDVGALAIFAGPEAYISPSLYRSKQETGKVVPTWNYAVVHARGPLVVHDSSEWVRELVTGLTRANEAGRAVPWQVTDAPSDYVDTMLKAIVGIEIPIRVLEGKWKVSQNRVPADRAGVVEGLEAGPGDGQRAMAALVAEADRRLPGSLTGR